VPQRRKEILRRPRLLDVLHRNINRKLTFVSAPAGYGKTALLIDFVADVEAVTCWYSVSAEHTDLATFVQYLVTALQQQFPKFGKELLASMQSGVLDPYGLAVAVSNEMSTQVTDFCLVVLDDFHLVGEAQGIVSFVEALIENLPEQVRFIAASRSVYGVPTVALYLHEELLTLGVKELRFRAEELQALVRQNYRMTLPADQAVQLAKLTDGWVVALLLALRALADGEMPRLEGHTDQLYAFLADEVLARQPQRLQEFLLATSILDEFNEDACNWILNTENSGALILELSERNLFMVQIETSAGPGYQFHQLFLEFLRDRLWKQSADWARQLAERVAAWYGERENWEQAVRYLWLADKQMEAIQYMDSLAPSLYLSGRIGLLDAWGERLAGIPDFYKAAPRVAVYRAKSLIDRGQAVQESEQLLLAAELILRVQDDKDQVANVLLTLSVLYRRQEKFEDALRVAQLAEDLLPEKNGYRWLQAQRMQGMALAALGQLEAALQYSQQAAKGFRSLGANYDLVATLDDLTHIQHMRGDIFGAQNSALEAVQVLRQQGGNFSLANSLNNAGYVLYQIGRFREAWQLYQEGLPIAQTNKISRVLAHLLNSRGDLLRDVDEWRLAEAAYNLAKEIAIAHNYSDALNESYTGLSELERLRGNFNEALYWLREATRSRQESIESPLYQLGLGSIYLDMAQGELARQALLKALSHWSTDQRPKYEQTLAGFLLARAYFETGDESEALVWLGRVLQQVAQLGFDHFLVVAGRRTKTLLERALVAWPNHPQVRSLLQRIDHYASGLASLEVETVAPESPSSHRIEVLAFGPGVVRQDGTPISNAVWKSSRSRALFFFICDQGQATKEQISLAFWPDFSPEKVTSNFHATLWRVRNALGQDVLVFASDVYMLGFKVSTWYDVAEFEAFAKQAANPSLTSEERIEAWRQAIGLYKGPFLDGVDMEWAIVRRSELESIYRNGLVQLARWELNRLRFIEARHWYEELLRLDPYYDEAQIGLIHCQLQAGLVSEARASYLSYKKRLASDLGVPPSAPLRDLADRFGLK
jgi:ATP/maltotriose-dependent transcriptional regulator MalT/DNA-binding SARP family transcriptional activator